MPRAMPRTNEITPLRRFLQQAIMWIVLAATIGAATLVSANVNKLGEPRKFGELSLRLPQSWEEEGDDDDSAAIVLTERGDSPFSRALAVRYDAPSFALDLLFGSTWRRVRQEKVELQDGAAADVMVRKRSLEREYGRGVSELEVLAVVQPPGKGRPVIISIKQLSYGGSQRDAEMNMKLMKRILETVRFGGEDQIGPG